MRKMKKLKGVGIVLLGFFLMTSFSCKKSSSGPPDHDRDTIPSEGDGGNKEDNPNVIRYGQFNIEYDKTGEPNPWSDRKYLVKNIFDKYKFDIATIDEAYYSQLSDMNSLIPGYSYYGSTVQGTTSGTILTVGILYKTDRFEVKNSGRFWLSPTPSVPSKSFAGHQYRICNWAFFKDKKLGTKFYVFATHISLARYGDDYQWQAVSLITDSILSITQGYPTFLSGDFNFTQYTMPYTKIAESGILTDSYLVTEKHQTPYQGTYNGYNVSYATSRIDHIFLANCNNFEVKSHEVITDSYGGKYPSDHYPVLIKVIIPKQCSTSSFVKDTIKEDFQYAVIQSDYLKGGKEITPSGIWVFDGALVKNTTSSGDYKPMAPRLKGAGSGGDPGYIQTGFSLKGLKQVTVEFAPMTSGVVGPDFSINIEVSTDGGANWSSIGTKTIQKGHVGSAEFSPNIPGDKNVMVRITNNSPDTGNLTNGNQINILGVTFIQP